MKARPGPKRPAILVLAGVNGAGKSSVAGSMLADENLTWFNPDDFSRELLARTGMSKGEADAAAWTEGKKRLEAAIAEGSDFAFETTLGGNTISELLAKASATHDVKMIFCGLASIQMHIDRVQLRVRSGGHSIPEDKIRQRWDGSRRNLIGLMPELAHLQVFDNSVEAAPGGEIPDPVMLLESRRGKLLYPDPKDLRVLQDTPDWAKPLVEAAIRVDEAAA